MSKSEPNHGGDPHQFGECVACGAIYPAQTTEEDGLRPIGLEDGSCTCGNQGFQPVIEQ